MTHTIEKVKIFHETFGHPVAEILNPGTKKLRELRVNLIAEELTELCEALGVCLHINRVDGEYQVSVLAEAEDSEVDIVETADALGDLDYVVQGANLVFGIPSEKVLDEIQDSNMSKADEDGKPILREDGKILKGPNYFKPDILQVLQKHEPGFRSPIPA